MYLIRSTVLELGLHMDYIRSLWQRERYLIHFCCTSRTLRAPAAIGKWCRRFLRGTRNQSPPLRGGHTMRGIWGNPPVRFSQSRVAKLILLALYDSTTTTTHHTRTNPTSPHHTCDRIQYCLLRSSNHLNHKS